MSDPTDAWKVGEFTLKNDFMPKLKPPSMSKNEDKVHYNVHFPGRLLFDESVGEKLVSAVKQAQWVWQRTTRVGRLEFRVGLRRKVLLDPRESLRS